MFPIASVDGELVDADLDQHQYLYHISRLSFALKCYITYPTDDKGAIVKPQLPLVLANPDPSSQEGTSN
jgi:hypothetical protein